MYLCLMALLMYLIALLVNIVVDVLRRDLVEMAPLRTLCMYVCMYVQLTVFSDGIPRIKPLIIF